MKRVSRTLALISLFSGSLLLGDIKRPFGPIPATFLRYLRLMAGAFSPFTAVLGGVGAILGLWQRRPLIVLAGALVNLPPLLAGWLAARKYADDLNVIACNDQFP